jgi:hypothetical protein
MVHDGAHNVIVAKHDDEKWATVIKDKQAASEGNSLFEFRKTELKKNYYLHCMSHVNAYHTAVSRVK